MVQKLVGSNPGLGQLAIGKLPSGERKSNQRKHTAGLLPQYGHWAMGNLYFVVLKNTIFISWTEIGQL